MAGDKRGIHSASMPKILVFTVLSPLCTTHCAKDVEQDTLSQASMPLATMPKTLVLAVFLSLYNIPHTDVEQGNLSQASMPLATMPKTLIFTLFLFLYGLRVADCGLTNSISETESQCNKE